MSVIPAEPTANELHEAMYGKKKRGARIKVAPPEERTADGIVFHSKHEMNVYLRFKPLVRAGTFKEMKRQVPYPIHVTAPNGQRVQVGKWLADFVITALDDRVSVYDAKGHRTEMYKLKKKCVEAEYGIRILEV